MCGLQGAGKTTTAGKLANNLKKSKTRDHYWQLVIYIDLQLLNNQRSLEKELEYLFYHGDRNNPVDIAKAAIEHGRRNNNDCIIIDTAGRLHIDDDLMNELENIYEAVSPQEVLLVVDAMTGQDAVNVADINLMNDLK